MISAVEKQYVSVNGLPSCNERSITNRLVLVGKLELVSHASL